MTFHGYQSVNDPLTGWVMVRVEVARSRRFYWHSTILNTDIELRHEWQVFRDVAGSCWVRDVSSHSKQHPCQVDIFHDGYAPASGYRLITRDSSTSVSHEVLWDRIAIWLVGTMTVSSLLMIFSFSISYLYMTLLISCSGLLALLCSSFAPDCSGGFLNGELVLQLLLLAL